VTDLTGTIDLSTTYLGLHLKGPLVVSPSPLCEDLGTVRKMEDQGAAAVVLHSLFEEQIRVESQHLDRFLSETAESYAEATSYFPDMTAYNFGPDGYLEYLRRVKEAVEIPVIGSLNGATPGGWLEYAKLMQDAGADALELNVYYLPNDPELTGELVERNYCDLVSAVSRSVTIPVAVKLGPYFSAMSNMAQRLEAAGASGLVLFNRFYQPDFDLEALEVVPNLILSNPYELLLRLHWVAVLYNTVKTDLAITGGVHSATDVIKCMMAGANVAMMTSALLRLGVSHIAKTLNEVLLWMDEHEYSSIRQMQGSMSRKKAAQPSAFERANYMKVISSYAYRAPNLGYSTPH
jgi:dihydroorotate dehydrogenase (fumarate)